MAFCKVFQKHFIQMGMLKLKENLLTGRQHGTTRIYHDDKSLALEAFFIDDKLQGDVLIYDKMKTLRVRDTYINDELIKSN